jgi:hypothetical protein
VEPVRLEGEPHPVPLVAAFGFIAISLLGFGVAIFSDGGLLAGVVIGVIFGVLGVLFALECIPSWVELDASGIRYRVKLRVSEVAWNEIAALGKGIENDDHPGMLLIRLTPEACGKRGLPRAEALFHLEVPAVASCRQDELLALTRAHWSSAGGSGETFTIGGVLLESAKNLRRIATELAVLTRENPPRAESIQTTEPAEDVYCSILHVRSPTGALFFCVVAGSDRLDALARTIRETVEHLAREHRFNPEFEGRIQVSLVPDLTPNTDALGTCMNALVRELETDLKNSKLFATNGNEIQVSWTHGHPPLAGAGETG